MKIVPIIDQEKEWDQFVNSGQGATSYHQFKWKGVFCRGFGYSCHYLAAIDEAGEWQGILPLVYLRSKLFGSSMVSMPFVNYGGVLAKNDAAAQYLLQHADRLRTSLGAAHIELRHLSRAGEGLPTRQHKVTMLLELAVDLEKQWQGFNAKLRNQIRKAQKSGLRSSHGHLELLDGFYSVFARNMRDLGTPVHPKIFFRSILEAFPETSRIFAVYHEEKVVASGFTLWFKGNLEIPWASSVSDYKAFCPNNLLYWDVIRFGIERGFNTLDFGRSTPNEGTYNFKKQWGARPVPLYWQYLMDESSTLPELRPGNPKYQAAVQVWQRLPVPITKVLGPIIVRNVPLGF